MVKRSMTGAGYSTPPKTADAESKLMATGKHRPHAHRLCAKKALGHALKAGRQERGLSQFELSLETGVSQRHIAFIELGRAKPSRALLLRLLNHLNSSPSLRNAALFHAGYLPEGLGDSVAADHLDRAVHEMIKAHFPFPAVVFDADWRVRLASSGAWWLFPQVMPDLWRPDIWPLDIIAALGSPDGILSKAKDAASVGSALLAQIEAEALATPSLQGRLDLCAEALVERYGSLPKCAGDSPALTITFETGHGELSFFSIQIVPGLPQNISIDSLRVELSFPADERTREIMMREVTLAKRDDEPLVDLPEKIEALAPLAG